MERVNRYTQSSIGSRRDIAILRRFSSGMLLGCLTIFLNGCDRNSEKLLALQEENTRLSKALQEAQQQLASSTARTAKMPSAAAPDLIFASLNELWSQRFEDNKFRAKQRLDQKKMRVTGTVESVTARSVTLSAVGTRVGAITILAQLDDAYARQVQSGLASLEKGRPLSVQGRFIFDKMWLSDAVLVNGETGEHLSSEQVAAPLQSSP